MPGFACISTITSLESLAFEFDNFWAGSLKKQPVKIDYSAGAAAKRRADHAMEAAEDYVELIEEMQTKIGAAHITDLASHMGVSHVTVHKTLKRLKAEGFVIAEPYRAVTLTEEGKALARDSRRRHEVTLRFLRNLGICEEEAQKDAEGIEHHVGEELMRVMNRFSEAMEANGSVSRADLTEKREGESSPLAPEQSAPSE